LARSQQEKEELEEQIMRNEDRVEEVRKEVRDKEATNKLLA